MLGLESCLVLENESCSASGRHSVATIVLGLPGIILSLWGLCKNFSLS